MCLKGLIVRAASRDDLPHVYAIEVSSFDRPYPYPYLEILLNLAPDFFLVAECEESIVGYVIALPRSDSSCHIVSIAVAPAYRRKRIGAVLLQSIMHTCSCHGYRRYVLEVEYTNVPAKKLYEKSGFKLLKSLANYYGPGRHAEVMVAEDYSHKSDFCGD